MSEHTPSIPLGAERSDMHESSVASTKCCMVCGSPFSNQCTRDYYKCEECGQLSTEFTREP